MINELWSKFKKAGFSGAVSLRTTGYDSQKIQFSVKSDSPQDDTAILQAVFGIDPDYTVACIIKDGFKGTKENFPIISFAGIITGEEQNIADELDKAITEGLAHVKTFVVKESGDVVRFGYVEEDIFP